MTARVQRDVGTEHGARADVDFASVDDGRVDV